MELKNLNQYEKIIDDVVLIDIPKIVDPKGRGKLSVIEKDIIPFSIKKSILFI